MFYLLPPFSRCYAFSPDSSHTEIYTRHTIAFKAYLSPRNNSESLRISRNFNLKMVETSYQKLANTIQVHAQYCAYTKFYVQSLAFHLQLIFFSI